MLDVLEHIKRPLALDVLEECKRVATKLILLFLPCNECPQGDLDENPYQRHLSTWQVEDFTAYGHKVEFFPEFHTHVKPPADAAWVWIVP
jgi:hypothetical protein